jgi:hypothetical protein
VKGLHRFAMSRKEMRAVLAEQDRRIAFLEGDNESLAGRLETRTNELARALHALEAEKGRVTVAQVGVRDTSAMEDQSTEPIDVRPLREALGNVEPKRQPAPQVVFEVQPIPPREPLSLRFAAGHRVVTVSGGI